jgi:hypothetical protein
MSGALVVDGIDQLFPLLHGLPERFFSNQARCRETSILIASFM